MELNKSLLKEFLPNSNDNNREKYIPFLNRYMKHYRINNDNRIAAFIAQIGHESGQLKYNQEIASGKAYEGRKDLGNIQAGDGVRFKGRGLIQITGRSNYEKAEKALDIDCVKYPELLEQPEWAVKSACWWWQSHGLNEIADNGDFRMITKIINGGYNGWDDRYKLWLNAQSIIKKYKN